MKRGVAPYASTAAVDNSAFDTLDIITSMEYISVSVGFGILPKKEDMLIVTGF